MVKFIVDGSVAEVYRDQDTISDLLSTITGGVAQIQDIQALGLDPGDTAQLLNIDRMDTGAGEEGGRGARLDTGTEADTKSVVDVFIRWQGNQNAA